MQRHVNAIQKMKVPSEHKMKEKGLIFDIQGFSVHDGPGIRTLIFLCGCPLDCEWCANPEGRITSPCLLYAPVRCRSEKDGCMECTTACPLDAAVISESLSLPKLDRIKCASCKSLACTYACRYDALRISGRYYSQQELMDILNRDRRFWGIGGGVTFGGGEPLMQGEFLLEILKQCRCLGIHTAIETCGYAKEELFLTVMEYVNFAFVDIKHMNPEEHRKKTGVRNDMILNNLRAFAKTDIRRNTRLILRMPVILGFNDSIETAADVIHFMKENSFFEINLLPFHRLGTSKWEQLGLTYPYRDQQNQSAESLYGLQTLYLKEGIACYVDTDVIYELDN